MQDIFHLGIKIDSYSGGKDLLAAWRMMSASIVQYVEYSIIEQFIVFILFVIIVTIV